METLLHLCIYAMALGVVAVCAYDHIRGAVDALSIRNIALVGFLIFMVLSARGGLLYASESSYNLADPTGTVGKWLVWCLLFLVVFFASYRIGFGAPAIARAIPTPRATVGFSSSWPLMIALSIIALGLKVVPIPFVAALSGMTAIGCAGVAAGIAGWVWGPRLFNPAVAVPAAAIVGLNIAIANFGEFSRRPMVSVGIGMVWGMYFSSFRYMALPSMAFRIGLVAVPPLILFSLYSSVRNWQVIGSTEIVNRMITQGDATGSLEELGQQDTARVGQWLMEYADRGAYETRPLFTVQYFFLFPVPRELLDAVGFEKPWPVSTQMADLSGRKGVKRGNTGVTNPAGIIGNAAVEGGLLAIVIYAALGAIVFRVADEYVKRGLHSAFLVLPVGSSLGQVMGIARGETSVFMFNFVWTTFSVTVLMGIASAFVTKAFPQLKAGDEDAFGGGEWDEGDEYYVDDGNDPDAYRVWDIESANTDYAWYDETEHYTDK
ncbi:MAG: hypothetical protein AAF297_08345 [Planctomycetota bacterium]